MNENIEIEKQVEDRGALLGVPPSGGSRAVPPKGGTPNQISKHVLIGPDRVMDVRSIPCSIKHGLIIKTWLELPVAAHFILFNDHDPVPLFYQFTAQWPGTFRWEHLVNKPGEVRVKITKTAPTGKG